MTPRLIVVRLDVDDLDGFHVLSMLKLDEDTRHIPVVTWTAAQEDEATSEVWPAPTEVASDEPAAMRLH
jgi:CheY-like chemotaxis protein